LRVRVPLAQTAVILLAPPPIYSERLDSVLCLAALILHANVAPESNQPTPNAADPLVPAVDPFSLAGFPVLLPLGVVAVPVARHER
jgi:hypothetical protein